VVRVCSCPLARWLPRSWCAVPVAEGRLHSITIPGEQIAFDADSKRHCVPDRRRRDRCSRGFAVTARLPGARPAPATSCRSSLIRLSTARPASCLASTTQVELTKLEMTDTRGSISPGNDGCTAHGRECANLGMPSDLRRLRQLLTTLVARSPAGVSRSVEMPGVT
jgi:hypothetical protein